VSYVAAVGERYVQGRPYDELRPAPTTSR
jgi:hypothetical protein